MSYLLDTNILLRFINLLDSQHRIVVECLKALHNRGETVCIVPQNLVEFHSVATRPKDNNGAGLTVEASLNEIAKFEALFTLLEERSSVITLWKDLIQAGQVISKQAHDARLVAMCQLHEVTHFLTFNTKDFTRFASIVPTLTIVDPREIPIS